MSVRVTGRVATLSIKLLACTAVLVLAVSCASSTPEEPTDTGSEFAQGNVDEVEGGEAIDTLNLQTIYFQFDQSEIQESARPVLRANGETLRSNSAAARLEGYCDERGDEEYNLALGERRAQSAKRYLENLGVPGSQMRTVSYGESRPAVQGHDESAWRYNRRVEFKSQ